MEGKREGYIVNLINQTVFGFSLHNDIADVLAFRDIARIQSRVLAGFLGQNKIAFFNTLFLAQ